MTIDTAITVLGMVEAHEVCIEAKDIAVDTMHKYQKIEQIVNAELEEYHPLDRNTYRLALIKEIIEHGKID